MNADSYFEIGSTHEVCQDYAISGLINPKLAFAIVTDGCTASHKLCNEVDFGARILAYAARSALFSLEGFLSAPWDIKTMDIMINAVRAKTMETVLPIGEQLKLHDMFADATLLIALSDGDKACVMTFGDGGVIVKNKDGSYIYDEISYLSSAPYYLSYLNNENRNNGYKIAFGACPVIHSHYEIPSLGDKLEDCAVIHNQAKEINEKIYYFSSAIYSDAAMISVTSDGIKSFQQQTDNGIVNISSFDMVPRFGGFKNNGGVFVQRRMNFLKKECNASKTYHYDDISIASINM